MTIPNDPSNLPAQNDMGGGYESNYPTQQEQPVLEFRNALAQLTRDFRQIIGLGLTGLALGAILFFAASPIMPVQTTTRVVYSFPGFEHGLYPDGSKFQADDLKAPDNIAKAMKELGLDVSEDSQSKVRNAISIEGIIPDDILKARDRIRASGQTPPQIIPDEYSVTLSLDRYFPLDSAQRNHLLTAIIDAARDNFKRTYGQLPVAFGSAFETLRGSDFPEYELVFNSEIANVTAYLNSQLEIAKSFRSPRTNYSFKDLLEQVNLFSALQLNEALGLIHQSGIARDRAIAVTKINYAIRQKEYDLEHAMKDESVVRELLAQAQSREQSYVLGIKSQTAERPGEAPILDQGLVDSLVANDSYNYFMRQALEAGLKVRGIEVEIDRYKELRDNLIAFEKNPQENLRALIDQATKSIDSLKSNYERLVRNVRETHSDFANQEYGNAIEIGAQVHTQNIYRSAAIAAAVGAFLGGVSGIGLSLLGFSIGAHGSRNRGQKTRT